MKKQIKKAKNKKDALRGCPASKHKTTLPRRASLLLKKQAQDKAIPSFIRLYIPSLAIFLNGGKDARKWQLPGRR